MKTFSLSRHSQLFSVPESKKDYLFVGLGNLPYHEELYRAESYAIAYSVIQISKFHHRALFIGSLLRS